MPVKVSKMYNQSMIYRTVVGRSSIRKVAEGRKEQIDDFLKELWSTEIVEVSHG